eukprot:Nitzschia sp. Nitz4//scaffold118_size93875//8505//10234//NITZ4_004776-RA/size93875-augustus-gene-0.92-mRNA-1//-1//CDS//3329533688//764//frame0
MGSDESVEEAGAADVVKQDSREKLLQSQVERVGRKRMREELSQPRRKVSSPSNDWRQASSARETAAAVPMPATSASSGVESPSMSSSQHVSQLLEYQRLQDIQAARALILHAQAPSVGGVPLYDLTLPGGVGGSSNALTLSSILEQQRLASAAGGASHSSMLANHYQHLASEGSRATSHLSGVDSRLSQEFNQQFGADSAMMLQSLALQRIMAPSQQGLRGLNDASSQQLSDSGRHSQRTGTPQGLLPESVASSSGSNAPGGAPASWLDPNVSRAMQQQLRQQPHHNALLQYHGGSPHELLMASPRLQGIVAGPHSLSSLIQGHGASSSLTGAGGRHASSLERVPAGMSGNANPSMPVPPPVAVKGPDGFPLDLPTPLALPEDNHRLSAHQVFLRQQIEAFRASPRDVSTHKRGRNKPILVGQVGIRCRHCAHIPVGNRQKGSTYFPAALDGLYQAAQNMSTTHLQCGLCANMPESVRQRFYYLISTKGASSGAGRPYWIKSAKKLGLIDTPQGIRFIRDKDVGESTSDDAEKQTEDEGSAPTSS